MRKRFSAVLVLGLIAYSSISHAVDEQLVDLAIHAGAQFGTGVAIGTLSRVGSSVGIAGVNSVHSGATRVMTGAWPKEHLISSSAESMKKAAGATSALGVLGLCGTVMHAVGEDPTTNQLSCVTIAGTTAAFPGLLLDGKKYKSSITKWGAGIAAGTFLATEGTYVYRRLIGEKTPNENFIDKLVTGTPSTVSRALD